MDRETLLASLIETADDGAVYYDDGRYIDFSITEGDGRAFEFADGVGDDAVQFTLTRAEMQRLHAALTRALLQE